MRLPIVGWQRDAGYDEGFAFDDVALCLLVSMLPAKLSLFVPLVLYGVPRIQGQYACEAQAPPGHVEQSWDTVTLR